MPPKKAEPKKPTAHDSLKVTLPKRINPLNMQAVAYYIQARTKEDPKFLAELRADPVKVLVQHGVNRKLAINMIANDVGSEMAICACTGCCCSACCISGGLIDKDSLVLPAANDTAGWVNLLNNRNAKIVR